MKAEIDQGVIIFTAENKTELYALEKWFKENMDQCTGIISKPQLLWYNTRVKDVESFIEKIKNRIRLIRINYFHK